MIELCHKQSAIGKSLTTKLRTPNLNHRNEVYCLKQYFKLPAIDTPALSCYSMLLMLMINDDCDPFQDDVFFLF